METSAAIEVLSSLAQETRMEIFRLLVRQGPSGMAAGEIASTLNVPSPTLSFHLGLLTRSGLLRCRRDGRSLVYAVNFDVMRDLLLFLTKDCCQGRPELCAGIPLAATCTADASGKSRNKAKVRHG
ncbi:MAG: helix-turn-helix transcriptional regulator [Candidatus Hydrogenedentes bacterium]|nr:helix-turn-helix transcriptional regulator [Candidatus Hydrogenedentota bacterium]